MPRKITKKRITIKKLVTQKIKAEKSFNKAIDSDLLKEHANYTNPIKSSLKVLGRTCFAEGQTVQKAILNLKPENLKGTGILTLERGDVKKERVIQMRIINNLWGKYVGRIHREIAWKNILLLFSGIFE